MRAEDLLARQRELRTTLLDRSRVSWSPARDLAAHLLLHLDDDALCWRIGAQWLREVLDADRVDAGFGSPRQPLYRPQVEALRSTRCVPSFVNFTIDATDPGVQRVWYSSRASVFADVSQERSFSPALRRALLEVGGRSKVATALWHHGMPIGLMCADWMERRIDASDLRCARFHETTGTVIAPVMAAVKSLKEVNAEVDEQQVRRTPVYRSAHASSLALLTPAERRVANLAATGMSYKEIARKLDRSFSTVDHQLRSVRTKLGVPSTGRLVRLLSGQLQA